MKAFLFLLMGYSYLALKRDLMNINPNTGPGNKIHATLFPIYGNANVTHQMDKIVIKNPMLFWIVNAVPTKCGGHALADIAEN